MRGLFFSITALLVGTSLVQLGGGLVGTLIAMQMAMREFPVTTAGTIMSAFSIGYVISVFYAHTLIERVGHIRAYAVFATILSAVTLVYPFAVSPWSWGLLRITQGFCFAGLSVCTESWLNERATNEVRGQVFSFYMIAIYVAQALGQFLLMVPDSSGYGLFVIASILLSLALVPVAMTHVPGPADAPAVAHRPAGPVPRLAARRVRRLDVGRRGGRVQRDGALSGPRYRIDRHRHRPVDERRDPRRVGHAVAARQAFRPGRPAAGHHRRVARHPGGKRRRRGAGAAVPVGADPAGTAARRRAVHGSIRCASPTPTTSWRRRTWWR